MSIIEFNVPFSSDPDAFDDFLDSIPDPDDMRTEELNVFRQKIEDAIAALNAHEPRNEKSEAYELWSDQHEELEDLLDDILDRLEEM